MDEFVVGQTVVSRMKFRNVVTGSLVDPSTVKFKVLRPDETEDAVKTFGSSDIVKNAVGDYQCTFQIDQYGIFKVRWNGTGGSVTSVSSEEECRGKQSSFADPLAA